MLQAAYVEMILFLHLNRDFILPLSAIPVLSKEELVEAIPPRHKYHQLDPIYKTREDEEEDMDDF